MHFINLAGSDYKWINAYDRTIIHSDLFIDIVILV